MRQALDPSAQRAAAFVLVYSLQDVDADLLVQIILVIAITGILRGDTLDEGTKALQQFPETVEVGRSRITHGNLPTPPLPDSHRSSPEVRGRSWSGSAVLPPAHQVQEDGRLDQREEERPPGAENARSHGSIAQERFDGRREDETSEEGDSTDHTDCQARVPLCPTAEIDGEFCG